MRVLLIIPTNQYKYVYPSLLSVTDFPTGFAYLASSLKEAGHEVFGLNLNNIAGYPSAYEMVHDRLSRSLREVQPKLIGLGGLCTDYKFIKDALRIIRNSTPDVPVVCGGGIINHDAEYIFNLLKSDFCIVEEGEEVIVSLANALEKGEDYSQIPNLGYWKGSKAKFTKEDFNYGDIDSRPFPDYEPFGIREMLDDYPLAARWLYRYTRPYPRSMVLVTARSCPFNCSFCVHRRGPKYRARSIRNIIEELAQMYTRYEFNTLVVLDELFAVDKQRMKDFCNALLEAKETYKWDFDWMFQTHPSASLDYETLKLAKEAGCYFFGYGLESASPRVLASMNKKTKVPQIAEAIRIAGSVGIGFGGNFIFGDPAENVETVFETMEFFQKYCQDIHISMATVQAYPGSKIFEGCVEESDKLGYYEKIDESSRNMTSLPDRLWLPWVYCLQLLASSLTWVKSTNATYYKRGVEVQEVRAACPFCGRESFHREMVAATKTVKAPLWKLLRIALKTAWFYLLSPKHHFLKALKPILVDRSAMPFLATGCPYCGKRFRIILPRKSSLKKRLMFEGVWRAIK